VPTHCGPFYRPHIIAEESATTLPQGEKNLYRSPFGHIASGQRASVDLSSEGGFSAATQSWTSRKLAPTNADKRLAVGE
jgi:hypothetical protein